MKNKDVFQLACRLFSFFFILFLYRIPATAAGGSHLWKRKSGITIAKAQHIITISFCSFCANHRLIARLMISQTCLGCARARINSNGMRAHGAKKGRIRSRRKGRRRKKKRSNAIKVLIEEPRRSGVHVCVGRPGESTLHQRLYTQMFWRGRDNGPVLQDATG